MARQAAGWTVPREWAGETVFVLGGGPSLKGFDAEILRAHIAVHGGRVIATNEAGLSLCPWADALYWADQRWLSWNRDRLGLHVGRFKICRFRPDPETEFDVKVLPPSKESLATDGRSLSGFCSGGAAINLAFLFGAGRIVLLGFDMAGGNFHDRHAKGTDRNRYRTHFMPRLARMAEPLRQHGVEVLNAWVGDGPVSALRCFPQAALADVLGGGASARAAEADAQPDAEDGAAVRGLELVPARELDRRLAGLAAHRAAEVTIRLRGTDVVTRRSAEWWRRRLEQAWPVVALDGADGGVARFRCRRPE